MVSAENIDAPHFIAASSGMQVWKWDHMPFGETAPNQNPAGLGSFSYDQRFPGQVYDSEYGLSYSGHRDYNAALGRYVESDPIGLAGGINTYGYVGENPLVRVDPRGLTFGDGASASISDRRSSSSAQMCQAGRTRSECIELCSWHLEKPLPFPGSDRNTWDFQSCVISAWEGNEEKGDE